MLDVIQTSLLTLWRSAMKTLVVKDLFMTERMDGYAMARVRGGILIDGNPPPPSGQPAPLPIRLPKLPFEVQLPPIYVGYLSPAAA